MRVWAGVVAAVVVLGAGYREARADCMPRHPWARPGVEQKVPVDPTVYVFEAEADEALDVRCVTSGDKLAFERQVFPAAAADAAPNELALAVRVKTGDCSRFEIRTDDGDLYPHIGKMEFEVDPSWAPRPPHVALLAAERTLIHFGCGPENVTWLHANVDAPAFEVELRRDGETDPIKFVQWASSDETGSQLFLGRTMCRGPNYPLERLDESFDVRLTAMHADGSRTPGPWQAVSLPADYKGPSSGGTPLDVEAPPPPEPEPEPEPESIANPSSEPGPTEPAIPWMWIAFGLLGGLATVGALTRLRPTKPSRSDPP